MLSKSRKLAQRISTWLNIENIGVITIVLATLVITSGYMLFDAPTFSLRGLFRELWANLGTELLGISVTVLIIERLIHKRDRSIDRSRTIRDFKSTVLETSIRALEELKQQRWLYDGSLESEQFSRCNFSNHDLSRAKLKNCLFEESTLTQVQLQSADLEECDFSFSNMRDAALSGSNITRATLFRTDLSQADLSDTVLIGASLAEAQFKQSILRNADLREVNLTAAKDLTEAQLSTCRRLRSAVMVGGERYDGRFNLAGDLMDARQQGISPTSKVEMARFYGVDVDVYSQGQKQSLQPTN